MGDAISSVEGDEKETRLFNIKKNIESHIDVMRNCYFKYKEMKLDLISLGFKVEEIDGKLKIYKEY